MDKWLKKALDSSNMAHANSVASAYSSKNIPNYTNCKEENASTKSTSYREIVDFTKTLI